jgi:hypothetical protein
MLLRQLSLPQGQQQQQQQTLPALKQQAKTQSWGRHLQQQVQQAKAQRHQ